jgi:hypothetical protein
MTGRYIANKTTPLLAEPDPRSQLIASLTKILEGCPPQIPWTDGFKDKGVGLWTGPTSLAYLFFWVSNIYPELTVRGKSAAEWTQAYLACGSDSLTSPAELSGWGIRNEYLAYNAVKAVANKDLECVARLEAAVQSEFSCPEKDNEHWSGRAGTLALLRMVRSWIPETADRMNACMKPLIEHILDAVPWTFSGHRYVGPAHGDIGILTQLALCDESLGQNAVFEEQLTALLDSQTEDGHFFITPDPKLGSPDLVHHCHGSPGFIISLLEIRPTVKPELQDRIDVAVEKGRKQVWEKGLLRKEPNLCHGIVGNMLALSDWEQRKHFMAHATSEKIDKGIQDGVFTSGDDPYGLLWGEAGRAWGWMMIDTERDLGYPSYTDI